MTDREMHTHAHTTQHMIPWGRYNMKEKKRNIERSDDKRLLFLTGLVSVGSG